MNILFNCNSVAFKEILYVVAVFIRIILIAVPVMLIIFTMIGLMKTVMSEKVETSAELKILGKKIISIILIFIMVPIVFFIIETITDETETDPTVTTCINTISKSIVKPDELKAEIDAARETDGETEVEEETDPLEQAKSELEAICPGQVRLATIETFEINSAEGRILYGVENRTVDSTVVYCLPN